MDEFEFYFQTYELLPGGGLVALQTDQSFPRLRLFELHALPGSVRLPHAFYSTAGERLRIAGVPAESQTETLRRFSANLKNYFKHFALKRGK